MSELKDKDVEQVVGGDAIDVEFYYNYEVFPTAAGPVTVNDTVPDPFTVSNSSTSTGAVTTKDNKGTEISLKN